MRFKNILKNNLFISFLINAIVLFIVVVFDALKYEVNDDIFMMIQARNGYEFIMYQNILMGRFYNFLYRIYSGINWYSVVFVSLIFMSSVIICNLILNKIIMKFVAVTTAILFVVAFTIDGYLYVQFTKVAGITFVAGACLIYSAFGTELSHKSARCIAGVALMVLASMIRYSVLYIGVLAMGFMSLVQLNDLVKNNNKSVYLKRTAIMFLVFGISLLSAYSINLLGRSILKENKQYIEYELFNSVRANFLDNEPENYGNISGFARENNISENDYIILNSWNFADSNKFTIDLFKKLGKKNRAEQNRTIGWIISNYIEALLRVKGYLFCIICGFILLLPTWDYYKRNWIYVLLCIGALGAYYFMFIYVKNRVVYRVEYCVWMSFYISIAMSYKNIKLRRFKQYIALVLALLCTGVNIKRVEEKRPLEDYARKRVECVENYIGNNKDNFYFTSVNTSPYYTSYTAYGALSTKLCDTRENQSLLGGVVYKHPMINKVWEKYGITNPYSDLIDNNKLFLISTPGEDLDSIVKFMQENYNSNAHAERVDTLYSASKENEEDLSVYKIVASKT